jgi:hypothetical protein
MPVLFGVAFAVAMTWPLVLNLGTDIGEDLGDPLFQAWQVAWVGHAVLHQPLHLFQANVFWPLPDSLAFSDAVVGYAPAGLIAQRGPQSALVVYNLLFLLAYALAFLGAYLLARELGAGRVGATAAGAAFAYAPWRLAQNGHLQVISSGGVPLALFLLVRGYRRGSPGYVLTGWLVAAWQISLGFTLGLQLVYLLGVLGGIAAIVWWRRGGERIGRPLVIATAIGVCVLTLVSVGQARPYFRVIHDHPEAERTLSQVESFSPPPAGFLSAPPESFLWGDATAGRRNSHGLLSEQTLFPGLAITLLALAGLFSPVYPRSLRVGLGVGVLTCAVLSLGLREVSGPQRYLTPYRVLYDVAPGWNGVRTPGRINTLTSLGLALLAGAGVCLVLRLLRRRTRSRTVEVVGASVLVGAILLDGLGPIPHPSVPAPPAGQRFAAPPQLHLPIDFYSASRYSYWSVAGFPAIVNGTGAFEPTSLEQLRKTVETFPDAKSVAALRDAGVQTVVLHPELARGTAWEGTAQRSVARLPVSRDVQDGVVVYRLEPREA